MSPARRRSFKACVCGAVDCQRHGGQSNWAKRRSFGRGYTRSGWATNPPPANGTYGGDWPRIRLQVLKRDGYQCQLRYADICIGRAAEVDHVIRQQMAAPMRSRICVPRVGHATLAVQADRERWPNSAELPSGGIPGVVPRLRLR